MLLSDIIKNIRVEDVIGDTQCDIADVHIDSRRVAEGHLFVAMRGTQVDGHKYIQSAVDKGAVAIVCEQLPESLAEGVTYLRVSDSEEAVGPIATAFYGNPTEKVRLIGVTGTNGKTTIATLLYDMFRAMGYKVGLISTVCNYIDDEAIPTEHTTPDAITLNALLGRMADEGCKYVFMEVSSHSVAQRRIGGLKFTGGIFTNLTRDHMDYHKTVDNYLRAKKAFFDSLPKDAFVVTNLDDKNGLVMTQNTRAKVHTYSLRSLADFKGRILEHYFDRFLFYERFKDFARNKRTGRTDKRTVMIYQPVRCLVKAVFYIYRSKYFFCAEFCNVCFGNYVFGEFIGICSDCDILACFNAC